ncbi:MAG: CDP-diacylglycerol--glycerol-3-phosphate 3-phosphatidyltransferase [Actinomycetota bacterium]
MTVSAQGEAHSSSKATSSGAAITNPTTASTSPVDVIATRRVLTSANALTALRILLVPIFGVLLLREGGVSWQVAAFFVFAVAAITDHIDGNIARRRGETTELGALLDPIADKALVGTALVGLSILGELPWWVTVLVLVREIGVTLLRLAIIRRGVLPASRGGKVKTFLQSVAIGLLVLPLSGFFQNLAIAVMAVAVVIALATGLDYFLQVVRSPAHVDLKSRRHGQR